jgi:proline iminopeptidase
LNNFNIPVLFIYSEKNQAYPFSWAEKISGAYNTAELFKVNGVGHGGIIKDHSAWTQQVMPKVLSYFATL